jgi:hypothetical protein
MLENLLLVMLSLIIVTRSGLYVIKTSIILNKGVLVEGKVIGNKKIISLFRKKDCPIIEYTTNTGKTIKGIFKPIWLPRHFKTEKKVFVVYDERKPASFFIDNRFVDITNFGMLSIGITILLLSIFQLTNPA